jgi:hypothetical protein
MQLTTHARTHNTFKTAQGTLFIFSPYDVSTANTTGRNTPNIRVSLIPKSALFHGGREKKANENFCQKNLKTPVDRGN